MSLPTTSMAPAGHASWQRPQPSQASRSIFIPSLESSSAPTGQAARQSRAPMQRTSNHISSVRPAIPSGLWHHTQLRGHPFMKTVVRIPGPSSIEKRWMLKILPVRPPLPAGPESLTLELVRLSGDDLILDLLAQHHEVGVVTGHADQEVGVVGRVFLRAPQRFGVYHVDLQRGAA